jgi:predicted component of type VI protein secretion system
MAAAEAVAAWLIIKRLVYPVVPEEEEEAQITHLLQKAARRLSVPIMQDILDTRNQAAAARTMAITTITVQMLPAAEGEARAVLERQPPTLNLQNPADLP